MKTQATMQAEQLEKFARFLEAHPGIYPVLREGDAMVCGFQVGRCILAVAEMDIFVSSQPRLASHEAALFSSGILGLAELQRRKLL